MDSRFSLYTYEILDTFCCLIIITDTSFLFSTLHLGRGANYPGELVEPSTQWNPSSPGLLQPDPMSPSPQVRNCLLPLHPCSSLFTGSSPLSLLLHSAHCSWDELSVLLAASLRCNSHGIQFTHLKCTFPWLLVYPRSCASIAIINVRIFSSSKRNPVPIRSTPFPVPHWQPLTTFCVYGFICSEHFI